MDGNQSKHKWSRIAHCSFRCELCGLARRTIRNRKPSERARPPCRTTPTKGETYVSQRNEVSRLDVLKREIISGLFFEMVDEFIVNELTEFHPELRAVPLPSRDDLEVTAAFHITPHPVYLFAVRNVSQARLAALTFLEFQREQLKFKGYVVHDDFEAIPAKDRKRITSAADKQFPSFDDFRERARSVLLREVA